MKNENCDQTEAMLCLFVLKNSRPTVSQIFGWGFEIILKTSSKEADRQRKPTLERPACSPSWRAPRRPPKHRSCTFALERSMWRHDTRNCCRWSGGLGCRRRTWQPEVPPAAGWRRCWSNKSSGRRIDGEGRRSFWSALRLPDPTWNSEEHPAEAQ